MAETLVLVDARNVIRARWPNFREDRFVALTEEWAAREGVRPVIVFDGRAPAGAIGTSDESADDWIAREAKRLAGEGQRVWLVSSDRGLRQRVAPYVERTIGAAPSQASSSTSEPGRAKTAARARPVAAVFVGSRIRRGVPCSAGS